MQFSRHNQPKHHGGGRKPSKEAQQAATKALQEEMARLHEIRAKAFEAFLNATEGNFNGFEFSPEFHAKFNKKNAIFVAEADDRAIISTPFGEFKADEDGQIAYFFSESPQKTVSFNRSIYFF